MEEKPVRLGPRRQQIADLLLQGCDNSEIAKQLNMARRTVKAHFNRLFLRFGIDNGIKRVKLATLLYRRQLCLEDSSTEKKCSERARRQRVIALCRPRGNSKIVKSLKQSGRLNMSSQKLSSGHLRQTWIVESRRTCPLVRGAQARDFSPGLSRSRTSTSAARVFQIGRFFSVTRFRTPDSRYFLLDQSQFFRAAGSN